MKKVISEKSSNVLIGLGFLLIISGLLVWVFTTSDSINSGLALYGDFIGGVVGSLWSLAGIFLFYLALSEQRKESKISQETLSQQIKEFELQRMELEQTRRVFESQRFDTTYFNLLRTQREILNGLEISTKNIKTSGGTEKVEQRTLNGDGFISYALIATKEFYDQLPNYPIKNQSEFEGVKSRYRDFLVNKKQVPSNRMELIDNFLAEINESNRYKLAFLIFYSGFYSQMRRYAIFILRIMIFLNQKKDNIEYKDWMDYVLMLKAQLSDDEKLIVWFCMELEGWDKDIFKRIGLFHQIQPAIDIEEVTRYSFAFSDFDEN